MTRIEFINNMNDVINNENHVYILEKKFFELCIGCLNFKRQKYKIKDNEITLNNGSVIIFVDCQKKEQGKWADLWI